MQIKPIIQIILMTISVITLIQCGSTIPTDTKLMRATENNKISSYELRDRLNVFATRFSNMVERSANQISAQTNDPQIKENALLWKMNSIPAANQAIFLSDPLAALIDISALCIQMRYYLSEGNGQELFGEFQSIAIEASNQLEVDVVKIWEHARGKANIDSTKNSVNMISDWAETYPVEDISFLRRSVSDTLFSYMEWGGMGLQETVGSIAVSAYDIRERLTIYTDQVPKQARWQAEYLINKTLDNNNLARSFDNFDRITKSLEDITKIIEKSPDLASQLQYRTMAQLTAERIAIMDVLKNERMAALADIDRQRMESIKYLETFSGDMLAEVIENSENLIDHFYWRLFQILVLIYIVFMITFIILRKIYWPHHKS